MLYSAIVKKRIRQSFDQVNDHRWDDLMGSIAPDVHHRFLGTHAIGGERHDQTTLRRWFERLARVLPDLHLTINNIWVKGPPCAAARWSAPPAGSGRPRAARPRAAPTRARGRR